MADRYLRATYDTHKAYNAHITYNGEVAVPICNPLGRLIEFDRYVAADGTSFDLHAPWVRSVISDTGTGMAAINYVTNTGPSQDGQDVEGFFLLPRQVQMVVRDNAESRAALYDLRRDYVNALRPNRAVAQKTGTLKKFLPNGDVMCLDCCLWSGLTFPARDVTAWDERAMSDTLTFYAPDPVYYLDGENTWEFSGVVTQLQFPTKFPILFGGLDVTVSVIYEGDWPSYPKISIVGPMTSMTIINNSTGERMALGIAIPAGLSVEIDLAYNAKTAIRSDGVDLTPYLSGDVATWHLAPDPEVSQGFNVIHVAGISIVATTVITLRYKDRYIGLRAKVH